MFNPIVVREDFPILQRKVRGKPLVYLDNAATSQKPRCVIEALREYYETYNANIHRSVHTLGEEATERYEGVRQQVARFIGAPDPSCIVFTRNATEAINLVAYAWGRKFLREGDEILLSEMEHHSNLVPWQLTAQATGAVLKHLPITDDGYLDLDHIEAYLTPRTRLVALTQMSNVLGTINPLPELIQQAHQQGALFLVDGAQSVPHLKVNVSDLQCDFLAFSAHKMLGPTGVGVLYARQELLEEMDPFLGGGEMIKQVWLHEARWNEVPYKFEAGTPNIADIIAFGKALEYLEKLGMDQVRRHEQELVSYALETLSTLPDLILYGPRNPEDRGGVISFNLEGVHPHDVGTILDDEGIAIRAGHHCAQPLMRRLGVSATARASFYVYNTIEEIDLLIKGLEKVRQVFHAVSSR